ncbi:hypothetical protein [Rickettsiella endosymbiont of Dermanyssus gallinae]|uniref:hypothetical protein n=1 Tax=Rickettsiella endosymbiont of Dermanyssus gallinae TaxID=2856608 RepID=UPI001C52F40A|nr:hypothetical protein [Rickettsiella endosymbiont of Dermanyssus gallinae]
MLNKLDTLLSKKKISKEQYDLFLLFSKKQGSEFLKNQLLRTAMEESPAPTNPGFAWTDGRRSVWRDIQNTMTYIHQLLEEDDGNNE